MNNQERGAALQTALEFGEQAPQVEVRRSERRQRTVSARLRDGKLVVYLPGSMSEVEERKWVAEMARRFEARALRRRLNSDGELHRRAAELNRQYFGGRLSWKSLEYVTNQSSRYGSCTPGEGTIRISSALAGMPRWVRDYVLMHELAHLVEANHSKRFWALVNRYPLTERARGYLIAKGIEEES
ncbi:MAG TPA: M48 family metallopeptidase [Actinomycetota bacterium]|nr:M48 family metallopeptidase [Actinomycetota bacterium]